MTNHHANNTSATPERMNRHYSPEEIEKITLWYRQRGADWLAKRLNRTPRGVEAMAQRLGIDTRTLPDRTARTRVSMNEATVLTGATRDAIYSRAIRAGVLQRHGGRQKAAITSVPTAWLLAQHWRVNTTTAEEFRTHGWLTTAQAADYCAVAPQTILQHTLPDGPEPRLRSHEARGTTGTELYFHPQDVEDFRVPLDNDRRRAKDLVSLKAIAVEAGRSSATAHYHATALGIDAPMLRGRGNIRGRYVTPEDAQRILARIAAAGRPKAP